MIGVFDGVGQGGMVAVVAGRYTVGARRRPAS